MITYNVIKNPFRILQTAIVRITVLRDEYWRIVVFFLDPAQCLPESPRSNLQVIRIVVTLAVFGNTRAKVTAVM